MAECSCSFAKLMSQFHHSSSHIWVSFVLVITIFDWNGAILSSKCVCHDSINSFRKIVRQHSNFHRHLILYSLGFILKWSMDVWNSEVIVIKAFSSQIDSYLRLNSVILLSKILLLTLSFKPLLVFFSQLLVTLVWNAVLLNFVWCFHPFLFFMWFVSSI